MVILHNAHSPSEPAPEIPLSIFYHAKAQVTYYNKTANCGRPPSAGNLLASVDPDSSLLTVKNKQYLLRLRGDRISGSMAERQANISPEALRKWVVEEGAALVMAGIVTFLPNANGFSIKKAPVPVEAAARAEFERVLEKGAAVSLPEYEEALRPAQARIPLKRIRAQEEDAEEDASWPPAHPQQSRLLAPTAGRAAGPSWYGSVLTPLPAPATAARPRPSSSTALTPAAPARSPFDAPRLPAGTVIGSGGARSMPSGAHQTAQVQIPDARPREVFLGACDDDDMSDYGEGPAEEVSQSSVATLLPPPEPEQNTEQDANWRRLRRTAGN